MLEELQARLAEISQAYRDPRLHLCQLEIVALEGGGYALSGQVLDRDTLQQVVSGLHMAFPALSLQTTAVKVLRGDQPQLMTVATNVTGLYAQPSFQAEMVSQLLNGWAVEVLMARDRWCFVRQGDGYLGWAYQPYLDSAPAPPPTEMVCTPIAVLRAAPDGDSPIVGRVMAGTAVAVAAVDGHWSCLSLAGGLTGWVPRRALRSLAAMPSGEAARRAQIVRDAARFVGVPYLWGGCTALGIDCSGFAQMLHRLIGITLPRDADMQYEAGRPAEPPFQPGDLLFFSEEGARRTITHVGVSLGGWRIIHSSRSRNGVYEDDVQAVEHLRASYAGARTFLR